MNRINESIKTVSGIQQDSWNFYYGHTGIDKVTRTQGGIPNLSIDYTTDPNGRILSMTYTEAGGYSGELFAVFNNFGDISAWVDSNGFTKYAAIYDLNNGLRNELYNPPQRINVPFGWNARNGDITIQVGTDRDLIINNEGSDFSITNPWGATDTMGWARPPKTTKGGGDDVELRGACPNGTILCCIPPDEKARKQIEDACLIIALLGGNYDECVEKACEA